MAKIDRLPLDEIFEITDEDEFIRMELKTKIPFDGMHRLSGKEERILVYKATKETDIKCFIYLKDGPFVYVDFSSKKIPDVHRWQLPPIFKFLQQMGFNLGPTQLTQVEQATSTPIVLDRKEQKKKLYEEDKAALEKSPISNSLTFLENNLAGLSCQSSIDPRYSSISVQSFYEVLECWAQCNIPKKLNCASTLEPKVITYVHDQVKYNIDVRTIELEADVTNSTYLTVTPIVPTMEVLSIDIPSCPYFKAEISEGKFQNVTYQFSMDNLQQDTAKDICAILKEYKQDKPQPVEEEPQDKEEHKETEEETKNTAFLKNNLGELTQEFKGPEVEQGSLMRNRTFSSVNAPVDQKSKAYFSEILVEIATKGKRGRLVCGQEVHMPDGMVRHFKEICPIKDTYKLNVYFEEQSAEPIEISYEDCPEYIYDALMKYFHSNKD